MALRGKINNRPAPLLNESSPFPYAEAYKTLGTNLRFASTSKGCKKIIITSAIPNEGKSTVATNLAITLAEGDAKVLLIDCDLRNSTLQRLMRRSTPMREMGLTSLLTGQASVEACITQNPKMKCDILLAGATLPNPVELLISPQMEALLSQLSESYDYIICDTPPVSIVTDAAALSRFCDGVILVVRQKLSTREQVHAAKRNLEAVQANILGTILSCYDISNDTRSTKSYYNGYYDSRPIHLP